MAILPKRDKKAKLLIVDNDLPSRERLKRSMHKLGYDALGTESLQEARRLLQDHAIEYAILELKLADGHGLELLPDLKMVKTVILTKYGNIASAVSALKQGARDYLPKPATVETIHRALQNMGHTSPLLDHHPMSPDRLKWEHIHRVFTECQHNVSQTARSLKMHRRTLQRILAKHAPNG